MCDGSLYKIGTSKHPKTRLKELRTANPYIELICFGKGVTEKYPPEMISRILEIVKSEHIAKEHFRKQRDNAIIISGTKDYYSKSNNKQKITN